MEFKTLQERCCKSVLGILQEKSWKESEVQKSTQHDCTDANTAQHPVPIKTNGKAPINFRVQGLKTTSVALAESFSSSGFQ